MRPRRSPSGSARRPAPTYYGGRRGSSSATKSPFQKNIAKKGKRVLVAGLDFTVVALIIVCLIYSLIVKPAAKVDANSFAYHPSSAYAAVASNKLGSLSNRNKITLSEASVVNALMHQFPEISRASVELPIFSEVPTVHITVAAPTLFLLNQGVNYIVDSDGKAVAKTTDYPKIKNLPQVTDVSSFTAAAGRQVLSSGEINFISTVLAQCRHAGVAVKALTLPQAAQEIDLTTTDQPYYVKFYLGGDVLTQTGQFLAARHQFSTTNTQPSEYLDVRIAGKVFYK